MKTWVMPLLQMAALIGMGLVISLSANKLRANDNTIHLTRNYFPDIKKRSESPGPTPHGDATSASTERDPSDADSATASEPKLTEEQLATLPFLDPNSACSQEPPSHLEHNFRTVSLDCISELLQKMDNGVLTYGRFVFVDARDDNHFNDGHIPGALQLDRYRIESYLDAVLEASDSAEKVIVYCNGGECTDSAHAAAELNDQGVPLDKLRLYEGGWEEWSENNMPIEYGYEE